MLYCSSNGHLAAVVVVVVAVVVVVVAGVVVVVVVEKVAVVVAVVVEVVVVVVVVVLAIMNFSVWWTWVAQPSMTVLRLCMRTACKFILAPLNPKPQNNTNPSARNP